MAIDKDAVHALRGYELQHLISLQALFYMLFLEDYVFNKIIIEGVEDIELRGPNKRLLIQVKKNEQLGQWKPKRVHKIADKLFSRWEKSTYNFDEGNCNDEFIIALQGDISKDVFHKTEKYNKCIISFEDIFKLRYDKSLTSNSKIKESIENIRKNSEVGGGFEPQKLNYFVRHLRICTNLPLLEDVRIVINGRIREYLSSLTTNTNQQDINQISNIFLEKIRNSAISNKPYDHIIDYISAKKTFDEFLEEKLEFYIIRMDRNKEINTTETVLSKKNQHAEGDEETLKTAIRSKNNFLSFIRRSRISLINLQHLYYEYIRWMKSILAKKNNINLDIINQDFIDQNQDLFKELEEISNTRSLGGIFFDLVSYCTFSLERINHVN